MDDKDFAKLIRELLRRPPLRRGPYIFDDDELRRTLRRLERSTTQ